MGPRERTERGALYAFFKKRGLKIEEREMGGTASIFL
jgi:hypothetical protein